MKNYIVIFLSGLVFALGLGISGMTQPAKVVGFLDVLGNWDPSLVFVMASAVGVYFLGFQWIRKRSQPIFATNFLLPTKVDIDKKLVVGAALFGVGWGLGGFCPGPALSSLVTAKLPVLVFIIFMVLGILLVQIYQNSAVSLSIKSRRFRLSFME